jgi:hypothetical protein
MDIAYITSYANLITILLFSGERCDITCGRIVGEAQMSAPLKRCHLMIIVHFGLSDSQMIRRRELSSTRANQEMPLKIGTG